MALIVMLSIGCNPLDNTAFEKSMKEHEMYEKSIDEEAEAKKLAEQEKNDKILHEERIKAEAQAKVDKRKAEMAAEK